MLLHKLDPEGDVLLTLHNSDAPFAVWREDWDKDVSASSVPQDQSNTEHGVSPPPGDDLQSETGVYPDNEQWLPDLPDLPDLPEDGTSKSIGPPPTVQFLLSSRHLILASKYFESTLCGPWKEGALVDSNGIRRVEAEGWSVASMLILMQVIHGHNRKVPRDLTLEALAKIAVLVNHYQCHDAVMTWSDIWINPLRNSMPAKFNRDIVLWILVAKVFEKNDLFNKATKIALEDCRGQLPTLNLPIMEVANNINDKRQEVISRAFAHTYDLILLLREQKKGCSFECSSTLLGALTIQLHEKGILDSQPTSPYFGYSISSTMSMILNLKSPSWCARSPYGHSGYSCNFPGFLACIPNEPVEGLELVDAKEDGSKVSRKSAKKNKIDPGLWALA